MLQLTRVYMGNSIFRGNASLNGQLSHLLEGNNVTQVLPLEPPDAWARRQDEVIAYLRNFRLLVTMFNKERPINCERYPGDGGGCPGEWEPLPCCQGTGVALQGQMGEGMGTRPRAKPLCGQREPFCGAGNFLPGAHPGVMLNLLLLFRKRAGGCSLWGGEV